MPAKVAHVNDGGSAQRPAQTAVIPLATPDLSGNEGRYLQECVTTGFVSSVGPFVTRFEKMVAAATGAREAVAVCSGTAGLHVALVAAGVRPGDMVIVPSFTFIATANAIVHAGGVPWIFDISPADWNLDPALVSEVLAAQTRMEAGTCIHKGTGRRVAAVLPVHVLGLAADMPAFVALCHDYRLRLVADAACAIGATLNGRSIADMGADLSVISFNGNKTVTSGGGGAIVGNDGALVGLVRHLSTTARRGTAYDHDQVGFNHRMTNLQAAVGCAQIERIATLLDAKRRIRATYDHAFRQIQALAPFPCGDRAENVCWLSGVVATDGAGASALRAHLNASGIEAKPFWKPLHLQDPYRNSPQTGQPVSEGLWQRVVTLPCSTHLTEADQARIIGAVLSWFP